MAQFSRTTAQIDALLDELVAARGGYSSLSAALAAKAGETEITEIITAVAALATMVATKQSLNCNTAVIQDDMNDVITVGSYYVAAASVQGTDHLPAGISGDIRVDVIEIPGDLRQQRITTAGSTPSIYIRNSTSAPVPVAGSLIPAMTSATTPSGEVIESGHYENRYGYQAFDGVDSQTWMSHAWSDGTNELDGDPDSCYVGYIWDNPQVVSSVKISFVADTAYTGCIQCRVDGVWQTVLPSITISGAYPYYTVVEQSLDTLAECDAIRFCILSGDRERFCAANYGGNVCEMIVYGTGGLTATWGDWYSVGMSVVQ